VNSTDLKISFRYRLAIQNTKCSGTQPHLYHVPPYPGEECGAVLSQLYQYMYIFTISRQEICNFTH